MRMGGNYRRAVRAVVEQPDIVLKAMGAVVMTSLWRTQDVVPGLSGLSLPLLITIMGAIALAMNPSAARKFKYLKSPITWFVIVLFIQLSTSAAFSLNVARARSFMVRDYSLSVVAFVIVACSLRSVRDLRWLIGVHVFGAAMYSFFVLLRFRALDNIGRLCCTPYYDANDISLVLVSTIPFFFFFLRDESSWKVRARTLAAFVPVLTCFQLAGSRGGFIGLAVIVLSAMLTYRGIKPSKRFTAVIGGMAALVVLGGPAYREKIASIFHPQEDYNMTDEDGRIAIWKSGIALAKQRPLVGFGPRSFGEAYGTYSDRAVRNGGTHWRAAHNAYIELAADAGFPATALFIVMVLTAIRLCWRVRNRAADPRYGSDGRHLAMLAQSNAIGLLGFLITSIFLSSEYLTITYFMLGLTVGLGKLLRILERDASAPQAAPHPRMVMGRPPVGAVARVGHFPAGA